CRSIASETTSNYPLSLPDALPFYSEALHLVALTSARKQDIRGPRPEFEDATINKQSSCTAPYCRRQHRSNSHGTWSVLSTTRSAGRQGQGCDGHGTEARRAFLQRPALWHEVRRSRRRLLRSALSDASDPSASATRESTRVYADRGGTSRRSFLGKRRSSSPTQSPEIRVHPRSPRDLRRQADVQGAERFSERPVCVARAN